MKSENKMLTSSSDPTVFRHKLIVDMKLEVVGDETSSLASSRKLLTLIFSGMVDVFAKWCVLTTHFGSIFRRTSEDFDRKVPANCAVSVQAQTGGHSYHVLTALYSDQPKQGSKIYDQEQENMSSRVRGNNSYSSEGFADLKKNTKASFRYRYFLMVSLKGTKSGRGVASIWKSQLKILPSRARREDIFRHVALSMFAVLISETYPRQLPLFRPRLFKSWITHI